MFFSQNWRSRGIHHDSRPFAKIQGLFSWKLFKIQQSDNISFMEISYLLLCQASMYLLPKALWFCFPNFRTTITVIKSTHLNLTKQNQLLKKTSLSLLIRNYLRYDAPKYPTDACACHLQTWIYHAVVLSNICWMMRWREFLLRYLPPRKTFS